MIFKSLYTEFIFNGHLQALGASGIVYIAFLLENNKSTPWSILIAIYALFQSIYLFDRFYGLKQDKKLNQKRSSHIIKYKKYIPIYFILLLIIGLTTMVISSNIYALICYLTILVFGLLYPIYFKGLTKKIFIFKNIYVSVVFSILPILYLVHEFNINWLERASLLIYTLVFFVFLESMISQILLDIKDFKSDKKIGLKTLPSVLGIKKTFIVTTFFSITSFLVFISFVKFNGVLSFYIALSLVINIVSIILINKKIMEGFIISAGKFFFWLLLSLIGSSVIY